MRYTRLSFAGSPAEVRAQWLEARKKGVGGSDVGAIMGLSPYRTALDVWLEKTGRTEPPDLAGNAAVEWGNRLEDVVAAKFAENHPELTVRRVNAILQDVEHRHRLASLDRAGTDRNTGERFVLEVKTAGERAADQWADGVPLWYAAQVVHYLNVTGWTFAYMAVLNGGRDYREYVVEPDAADREEVAAAVDTFWADYVLADQMPAVVGEDAPALAAMYTEDSGENLEGRDGEVMAYMLACQCLERAKAEKEQRAAELMARIGDAKGLETPRYRVTWSRGLSKRFDAKALKEADPETYEKFVTTSTRNNGLRIKEL